ncbi:DNA polymerase III subunit delta [Tissierella creatinini]|nr:DNA polymerase III subunit delta [Tissierella creatinini]TJX67189.1 DNA polymerase III subunit delta [Soehngenia saccharolytica]
MNYDDFTDILNRGNLSSTYLLMGDEDYLMNECIELVKKKYVSQGMEALNYSILDGKNISFDVLMNSCETLPFMASKKIVVLRDMSSFFSDGDANDGIYDYLDNLGNHLMLLFVDSTNDLKKTTKIYKYYNKLNKVVDFTKLKGKPLNTWVEKTAKKHKVKISSSNVNYFIQNSTYLSRNVVSTLYDLENEFIKIVSYCKNGEIQKEDIDLVMIKSLDNNIFDLLASVNRGDVDSSIAIFDNIYHSNEPVHKILFMLTRQIRLMLGYNIYRSKGYADGEIIDKLQIKPYEYQKISAQARNQSILEQKGYLDTLLQVDKKLKTSPTDERTEVEILLVKLCKRI